MSKLYASGHELRYQTLNEEYGDEGNPWLIFLHDGLGSIGQWKDFPEALSEEVDLPALVYERYGHGGSASLERPREKNYLHDEAIQTLPEVLDELEITEKVILVGHSDGGSIALLFAAEYPERTAAVITEAAHVFVEEVTLDGIQDAVAAFERANLKPSLEAYHDINTEKVFYGWSDIWLSSTFRKWNIEPALPKVKCPVLAIQGEDDHYGTKAQVDAIVNQTEGRTTPAMIPDCGHAPHHDQPEKVLEKMTTFIGDNI